jgi:N-acetyl-anhydromuramyl-L-alanine amidase AmpD
MQFPDRTRLIRETQRALGLLDDGIDGRATWGAIHRRLVTTPAATTPAAPAASTRYSETVRGRSPNRNPGINECRGIVFHHAAGWFEGTIDWCLRPGTNAAYHCLIAPDGTRAILGLDTDRLHHAGASSWKGRGGCNAFTLGCSFTGDTNTGAMRPHAHLTQDELASAAEWVAAKMRLHRIQLDDITHHRVVSPGRKDDLSPAAWDQLRDRLARM